MYVSVFSHCLGIFCMYYILHLSILKLTCLCVFLSMLVWLSVLDRFFFLLSIYVCDVTRITKFMIFWVKYL